MQAKEAEALEKVTREARVRELEARVEDLERETMALKDGQSADAAEQHDKAQAEREASAH